MKPFDHEAAASGQPFIHEVYVSEDGEVKDLEKIGKLLIGKRLNGSLVYEDQSGDITWAPAKSLRMLPKKRTVWINLHKDGRYYTHESAESAHSGADNGHGQRASEILASAVLVEIEE